MKKLLCLLTILLLSALHAQSVLPVIPQANAILVLNVVALKGTLLTNMLPQTLAFLAQKQQASGDSSRAKYIDTLQKFAASQDQDEALPLQQMAISFALQENPKESQALCFCTFGKPVSKDQLLATLNQQEDLKIEVKDTPQGVRLDFIPKDQEAPTFCCLLTPEAKSLFAGTPAAVETASTAATTTALPELLNAYKLLPKGAPIRLALLFPTGQQSPFAKVIADRGLADTPIGLAMQSATGIAISMGSDANEFGYRQLLIFPTPEAAQQCKDVVLDGMVLGLGKMSVEQTLGHSIPLLDSMATDVHDNAAEFTCRCTAADLEALRPLFEAASAQEPQY